MTDPSPDNMEALHEQRDWLLVTLSCIGDAVITTDGEGRVTFLNPVAESLTGWTQEAVGQPLDSVIRIINEESRQPVEIPTVQALREGRTVKLASHSLLIAKDGTERSISDSAAPITQRQGGSRRCRAGLSGHHRTTEDGTGIGQSPCLRRRHHCDPCENRSWFSTATCESRRRTVPSTTRFTSRRRKRRTALCTTWATASGTFPACGSCWMKSFPATNLFTTSRLNTPSRISVERPCCSTLGHSRQIPNTRS